MGLLSSINTTGVKPAGEFKDLEVGTYITRIEDAGVRDAKKEFDKSTGLPIEEATPRRMLALHIKVYGGPDDGHTEIENLNLWNPNSQTVQIALGTLAAIRNATGVSHQSSETDLIGKWMAIEVYLNRNNKKSKKYLSIPVANIPSNVPDPAPTAYPQEAQEQQQPSAATGTQGYQQTAPAAPAAASDTPYWA